MLSSGESTMKVYPTLNVLRWWILICVATMQIYYAPLAQTDAGVQGEAHARSDNEVLWALLTDLVSNKEFRGVSDGHAAGNNIVLQRRTAQGDGNWFHIVDNLDLYLNKRKAKAIPVEVSQDVTVRNTGPVSLDSFKPKDSRVILEDSKMPISGSFALDYPNSIAYVTTYLPGYSRSGTKAAVSFWVGPVTHPIIGTSFLEKRRNGWRVKWVAFRQAAS
jgi:hypothetical protein